MVVVSELEAAPEELVSAAEAERIVGVSRSAVKKWGQTGKYGARKIGSRWFFRRDLLPAREDLRAPSEPPVTVWCAGGCGTELRRNAADVRRCRSRRFYCSACFAKAKPELLREGLAKATRATRKPGQSATMRRRWQEGKYDVDAHAARIREVITAINRSPGRYRDRMALLRLGRGLPAADSQLERRYELDARRRQQSSTERSAGDLREWLAELWPTSLTAKEIGEELARRRGGGRPFTARYVRKLAHEMCLPHRAGGRPRKIGTT